MSSPHYIAREWQCHAATSVGYEIDGHFHQVAECSGFGRTSEESEQTAAQIVTALKGNAEARDAAVIKSLRMALADTAEALNATRLIMRDKDARDMAGAMVDTARRIVRATS